MPALIVDAGNTRTRVAAWPGDRALPRLDRTVEPLDILVEWDRGTAGEIPGDADKPVVLVSVVPDETRRLRALRPDMRVVDHRSALPFACDVANPAAVGPDRLANVAAARAAGLEDALIVDAGTATTFDLLDAGCFRGGMIAPGMAFAARRLGEEAARLDPVPFGPAPWKVGRDTSSAMAAGAWHSGTQGVLGTIRGLLGEYGARPVILTGGLGALLAWPGAHHDAHWTLRGAAILGLSSSLG